MRSRRPTEVRRSPCRSPACPATRPVRPLRPARRAGCPGPNRSCRPSPGRGRARTARGQQVPAPVPDFHSPPARTCGSPRPARGRVLGLRRGRPVRAGRGVELRQRPGSRAPPGLGPGAHPFRPPARRRAAPAARTARRSRTARPATAPRRASRRRAPRSQRRRAATPRAAPTGGPVVRWAGATSPRSVSSRVPARHVSCSTFHDGHFPVCWAEPATGRSTRRSGSARIAPDAGLRQIPYRRPAHPRGRQIADVAVRPAQHQRARPRPPLAPSTRARSRAAAPVPSLRLGVSGDTQPVVEQHHRRGRPRPRTAVAAGRPGPRLGAERHRTRTDSPGRPTPRAPAAAGPCR